MKSSIIYYTARKTSFCEKALKKSFAQMGLTLSSAVFANDKKALGEALTAAFMQSDVVFTVGGLAFEDSRSIRDIISQRRRYRADRRRMHTSQAVRGYRVGQDP